MEWLWTIQLAINFVVVVALFLWWKERRAPQGQGVSPQVLQDILLRGAELERQADVYRKKVQAQLQSLARICQQAQDILSGHFGREATVSLEEQELKALRESPLRGQADSSIPSVQELEMRKASTQPQIPVDLRTLLRDQLT